jgi:hypothetical protein
MPNLAEQTETLELLHRADHRSTTHADEICDAILPRIALTGFSVEVVEKHPSHALVRIGEVGGQIDRFVSDKNIKRHNLHIGLVCKRSDLTLDQT